MKRQLITLLFIIIAQIAFGQPKVETTIDSTSMMIGDQMSMQLRVRHSPKTVVLLPKGVKLGNKIEVLSERDSTAKISANEILTTKKMMITAFDSGVYMIPPVPIQTETNGIIDTIFSKAMQLTVVSPLLDSTKNIAPIKDILPEDMTFREDILPVLIGFFVILILISVIYYYTKRQKEKVVEKVVEQAPKLPPHVIAYLKLKKLDEGDFWQKGDFKTYHSEISYTMREYLENRFDIPALESVTAEIMASLNGFEIENKQVVNLKNILQTADLVKFAKLIPSEIEHRQAMDFSLEFVEKTQEEEEVELKVEK
jgi:hypothetical protein